MFFGSITGAVEAGQRHGLPSSIPALQPPLQLAQAGVSAEVYLLVQQLQQEVRELRGKVEELNYRVNQSSKQERERYLDLDRRLLELSKGVSKSPVVGGGGASITSSKTVDNTAAVTPQASASGVTESSQSVRASYNDAYDLIKQRRYDEAVTALHTFIKNNPNSDLTPNAYYWLGEVYLVLPKLEQARQSFIVVVGKYPEHRKAADALYKLGVTYHRLGNDDEATTYLEQTLEKYPDSSAANLAREYIKRI